MGLASSEDESVGVAGEFSWLWVDSTGLLRVRRVRVMKGEGWTVPDEGGQRDQSSDFVPTVTHVQNVVSTVIVS